MKLTDKITKKGKAFYKKLSAINNPRTEVSVGVFDDSGDEPDGTPLVEIARIHEFGGKTITTKDGRTIQNPPRRSWLRDTFDLERRKLEKRWTVTMRNAAFGKGPVKKYYDQFGALFASDIQLRISNGINPPNAETTIMIKGSSKPLIDTGNFRSSITFKTKVGS